MPKAKTVDESPSEEVAVEAIPGSTESVEEVFARKYALASAPFDKTYQRQIPGGRSLTYITGEQVVSRMNEVFGPRWDWTPDEPKIREDEIYLSGTLTVEIVPEGKEYGHNVSRAAFGGATIKRRRPTVTQNPDGSVKEIPGAMLSLGNDIKAADTDAFKKAAAKFGVGLYLSERSDDGGEAQLPSYNQSQAPSSYTPMAGLPNVGFPTNNSNGDATTGPIEAVSMPKVVDGKQKLGGVKVNGQWYNVSNRAPINLSMFQRGQVVTIAHAPGQTFIDGMTLAGATSAPQEMDEVEAF